MKLMEFTHIKMSINSNSDSVREKAARDLGVDDEPKVVDLLIKLIKDQSPLVRRAAAESLGKTKSEKAFEPLVHALKDFNPGVRKSSTEAIGKLRLEKNAPILAELLLDKDPDVRQAAEEGLVALGDLAVQPTAKMITANNPDYARSSAIRILARTRTPSAVQPLVYLFLNQSENLPLIADALRELKWKPTNAEEFVRYYLAIDHLDTIVKVGTKVLPALTFQLSTENKDIKLRAIKSIGMLKNSSALEKLMELLDCDDTDIRAAVIKSVGEIADPETTVPIIFTLNDESEEVVVAACEALANLKDSSSISALVKTSETNNYIEKSAAIRALGQFDDPRAISAMISGLHEKRHEVRKSSIDALIGLGSKTNVYFADCLTDNESHVKRTGIMALRQAMAVEYGNNIIKAILDKEYSVKREAIEALCAMNFIEALPNIMRAVGDENNEVQIAAINALGEMGDAVYLEILVDCSFVDLLHDEAVRAIYKILQRDADKAKNEDLEKIAQIKVTTSLTERNSLAGDVLKDEIDPSKINNMAKAELKKRE